MAEFECNLWAPWRMEYIAGLHETTPGGCFLCEYRDDPARDEEHLVLWRTSHTLTVLNRFPYTGGHLLIAPLTHGGDPVQTPLPVLCELAAGIRDCVELLGSALAPQGYNIGMNLGRCAGAGLPDHLHWHVVPRWNGDTNFMPVLGDVRVIPEALRRTHARLRERAAELGLPR